MTQQGMSSDTVFSPGIPMTPYKPLGTDPSQYQYVIGQNIVQRPRQNSSMSFESMKQIILMCDMAQIAIQTRQDEIGNLDWTIRCRDENQAKLYESEVDSVRKLFEKPNLNLAFDEFQKALTYDWLAYDAATIYLERNRAGKITGLRGVDGTTITPIIDERGHEPQYPATAYVQYMWGLPYVAFDRTQLIYKPDRRRNDSVYGLPPVEWLMMQINTDIRLQMHFLYYFTEGSVPDVWINTPDDITDPSKIREFQKLYDAVMMGDQAQKHKVKFIPPGSKVQNAKEMKFDTEFPLFLLQKICAAYKVTPAELGFTEKVNKSSGDSQENVQYRRSIKPSVRYLQALYNDIIQNYLGFPNIEFVYLNVHEKDDELKSAAADEKDIRNGVLSVDEARAKRHGLPIDEKKTPRFIVIGNNAIPIERITEAINSKTQLTEVNATNIVEKRILAKSASTQKFVNETEESYVKPFGVAMHDFLVAQGNTLGIEIEKQLNRLKKADGTTLTEVEALLMLIRSYSFESGLTYTLGEYLPKIYFDSLMDNQSKYFSIEGIHAKDAVFHNMADEYKTKRTAELVTQLEDSTKTMLKSELIQYMDEGLTPSEIAKKIQENFAFSERRAMNISRTETGFAWNDATLSLAESGGATGVLVYDGDYDKRCIDADGQVWSFKYARSHLLEHPNCVRSFAPSFDKKLDRW